jgi:hypothetical protein
MLRGRRVFVLLSAVNALIFLDRGILPGASQEINAFIQIATGTEKPDIYLGLVQVLRIPLRYCAAAHRSCLLITVWPGATFACMQSVAQHQHQLLNGMSCDVLYL